MGAYSSLMSPLTIRNRTFRNRLLSTAHAPGYAEAGLPGERYQAYHEAKAKGGVGLTMFGGSSNISRDSGSIYGQIYVGHDAIIPAFRAFAKRMHRHGAALMCQISHMGRRTGWASGDWLPTIAPSPIRDPAHHSVPREMTARDIRRVTQDFADAAWRCREGGLDGCEILATSHLLGQFLSPLSNRRDDAYGGTPDNRARFLLEVLEATRARVGQDFIVGLRLAADESNEGGLTPDAYLDIARMAARSGTVDFLNVNGTYSATTHGLAETYPGMYFPAAPYVALASAMRAATGLPVFQAARLSDPATADWAIANGHLDMAGLTRPHMADPEIGTKLAGGQEALIRPCVGAGYCIDRVYGGRDALCVHNVSTGRETTLPHAIPPADNARRVSIIGGGPAGMEAARVAALRGHEVTLYEASTRLGGQIRLATKAGWRRDMSGIADWLATEIDRLGVRVHLNTLIEGPEVLDDAPDIVFVATGGVPDLDLPEGGSDLATSTWDILSGSVPPARNVLIYDETGSHGAMSTAAFLADQAKELALYTPDSAVGRDIGGVNRPLYLRDLYRAGTRMVPDHRLMGLSRNGNRLTATFRNDFSRDTVTVAADQVIIDKGTQPADGPFRALAPGARNLGETDIEALVALSPQPAAANTEGGYMLFAIGDAVASRDIHAAMLDANRLARVL